MAKGLLQILLGLLVLLFDDLLVVVQVGRRRTVPKVTETELLMLERGRRVRHRLLLLLVMRLCLLQILLDLLVLLLDDLLVVVHVGRRRTVRKVAEAEWLLLRRGRRRRVRDGLSGARQQLSARETQPRHYSASNRGGHTDGLTRDPVGLLAVAAAAAVVGPHVVARLLTRRQHAAAVFDRPRNVERDLFVLSKHFLDDLVGLNSAVDALPVLEAIIDHSSRGSHFIFVGSEGRLVSVVLDSGCKNNETKGSR